MAMISRASRRLISVSGRLTLEVDQMGKIVTTHTLRAPGATLQYEVRGAGPVLLLIPGGPMDAGGFASVASLLTDQYTVVTYDPRGLSRSTHHDTARTVTPDLQADDAHRLLAAVGTEPADVFGSSGGALTGLQLAARHPEQVRTLVAHEPPVTELLPDRDRHRALGQEVYDTYLREGVGPAMATFLAGAGLDDGAQPQEEPSPDLLEGMARMRANFEFFLGHMWQGMAGYLPDIATLRTIPTRVVVAFGDASQGQVAHQAAVALAERLATAPVTFPGDHGGFGSHPEAFAGTLHEVLRAS
jgi:pimeloyl-ACP methyl ester carboxylesterase